MSKHFYLLFDLDLGLKTLTYNLASVRIDHHVKYGHLRSSGSVVRGRTDGRMDRQYQIYHLPAF